MTAHESRGGPNRWLELSVPDWPNAGPGQFCMISPGPLTAAVRTDPLLPRPMAVFRQAPDPDRPGAGRVQILYKVEGRGTQLMAEAAIGDRFNVVGPLGTPFPRLETGTRAVLVGGGTGVASLFELAERADSGTRVSVLLGARKRRDLMGLEDYRALDVDLEIATEDGSLGRRGLVTELLEPILRRDPQAIVHACGPTPMMRACARLCAATDTRCLVSLENTMACGFGVCLGCAAPRKRGDCALVCQAGPVFDARDLDWENLA